MRRLTLTVGIVLVVAAGLALATGAGTTTDASAVEGVWKVVHLTVTRGARTQEIEFTQPNLTIYTAKHYATLVVTGGEPRLELREDLTAEQFLAVWRPNVAHAGTYEVKGNEIHAKMILAKSPKQSEAGTFEVVGDTLVQTFTSDAGGTRVVKSVRVE